MQYMLLRKFLRRRGLFNPGVFMMDFLVSMGCKPLWGNPCVNFYEIYAFVIGPAFGREKNKQRRWN